MFRHALLSFGLLLTGCGDASSGLVESSEQHTPLVRTQTAPTEEQGGRVKAGEAQTTVGCAAGAGCGPKLLRPLEVEVRQGAFETPHRAAMAVAAAVNALDDADAGVSTQRIRVAQTAFEGTLYLLVNGEEGAIAELITRISADGLVIAVKNSWQDYFEYLGQDFSREPGLRRIQVTVEQGAFASPYEAARSVADEINELDLEDPIVSSQRVDIAQTDVNGLVYLEIRSGQEQALGDFITRIQARALVRSVMDKSKDYFDDIG